MTQDRAIDIKNASVFLGGREILHDLNWQLERGGRCFILGANGAGKTTLVKMLLGYAWPIYGAEVSVLGERFGGSNLVELRKRIAWVSPCMQQFTGTDWNGLQMVLSGFDGTLGLFRRPTDEETAKAKALMHRFKAEHLVDQQIFTMSSGEQVKILIMRALLTQPDLMILDEPSVYLDMSGREFLLGEIKKLAEELPELTILFITQRIEDILPIFNQGMILQSGRIMSGGARCDVLTEENLSAIFEMPIRLIRNRSDRMWAVLEQ